MKYKNHTIETTRRGALKAYFKGVESIGEFPSLDNAKTALDDHEKELNKTNKLEAA